MNYNHIFKIIPEYVSGYVQTKAHEVKLPYHNMLHTQGVVEAYLEQQDYHHQKLDVFYQIEQYISAKKDPIQPCTLTVFNRN